MMHDTEPSPKKRMPPLIVLGLTGPLGSGCTTVSLLFSTAEMFNNVLKSMKWVTLKKNGAFSINWEGLNKEIDKLYNKSVANGGISKNHDAFTKKLEIREAIKALHALKSYHGENKHLFRTLSVSDLIVFRTLMEIEKESFGLEFIKDIDKKNIYEEFVAIAKEHMNRPKTKRILRRSVYKGYGDYYKQCYDYKSKIELKKLGKYFDKFHKIATNIKNEFVKKYPYKYSEVMQDFGDNIRKCDDPFGHKIHPLPDSSYRLAKGITQMIYLLYKTKQAAFFVVDCLRNPYEVIYFRREFANFYLLSLLYWFSVNRTNPFHG